MTIWKLLAVTGWVCIERLGELDLMFPITAAATGTHTQEEQSLCVLGALLFSTSIPSASPACRMEPYAFRPFLLSCHPTCQSSLKMPPETHLEVYTYFTHAGPLCCLRRIPEPSCPLLYFSTLIWLTTPTQLVLLFCNPSGYQCHPQHLRVRHLPRSGFPVSQLINPTTTLQLLMKYNVNLESDLFLEFSVELTTTECHYFLHRHPYQTVNYYPSPLTLRFRAN